MDSRKLYCATWILENLTVLLGYQGWPKPGKQGTDESEQILSNLDETDEPGKTGETGQKTGNFRQKQGKKQGKPCKKRVNETESWQNRVKPKVLPNLGAVSVIPVGY